MYKESGGGLVRPERVASPASGAIVLIGLLVGLDSNSALKAGSALISMIFLIGIHQRVNELMQSLAHLRLANFHQ